MLERPADQPGFDASTLVERHRYVLWHRPLEGVEDVEPVGLQDSLDLGGIGIEDCCVVTAPLAGE